MLGDSKRSFFWRSVLVALAYGAAYACVREVSMLGISGTNWIPTAALRFICLLFVPTRYWPALIVGESIAIGYETYLCGDQRGLLWLLVTGVPRMLYAAPIVYAMRKHLPNSDKPIAQTIGGLLLCMLAVSIPIGLHDALGYSLIEHYTSVPIPVWLYAAKRVSGNYLTMLTIAPIVLWMVDDIRHMQRHTPLSLRGMAGALNDVAWRATCWLVAGIAGCVAMGHYFGIAAHAVALCFIVAALMAAAWRYGWKSTTLVGAAANLGVIALMPTHDDPLTILAQCMIAVIQSSVLLLGASVTGKRLSEQGEAIARQALATVTQNMVQAQQALAATRQEVALAHSHVSSARELARREQYAGESLRLDQAAMLAGMVDDMRKQFMRAMHDARHRALSSSQLASHYTVFDFSYQEHQRLTEALSPMVWDNFGGTKGVLAERLRGLGIDILIRPPSVEPGARALSKGASQALYRLACYAAVHVLEHGCTNRIVMHMTIGVEQDETVVKAALESVGQAITINPLALDDLKPHLNVEDGHTEQHLHRRAAVWKGYVRCDRPTPDHLRIELCMREPAGADADEAP